MFGFFSAGVSDCSTTSDLSSEKPICHSAVSPGGVGVGDCGVGGGSNIVIKEELSSSHHIRSNKLHLLTLRQTPSASDASFALACIFFQQQQLLAPAASGIEIATLPDFKLPLLSRNCMSNLCDASQADYDISFGESMYESNAQPMPSSTYVVIKQATMPSFQSYESKFRFLDSQIPPVVRPAISCVFAAAISAANASTSDHQAGGGLASLANSAASVHPCSLSPARHTKAEKQSKGVNPATTRTLNRQSKRAKTSEGLSTVSSNHLPAAAPTHAKAVSDFVSGALSTFASCKDSSAAQSAAADVAPQKTPHVAGSSENFKDGKKSPAYEQLKSKLWSKLHTKFRRETQPAVDVDLLKIVFNRCRSSLSTCFVSLLTFLQHAA